MLRGSTQGSVLSTCDLIMVTELIARMVLAESDARSLRAQQRLGLFGDDISQVTGNTTEAGCVVIEVVWFLGPLTGVEMGFSKMAVIAANGSLSDEERGRLLSVGWPDPTVVSAFKILGLIVGSNPRLEDFYAPAKEKLLRRVALSKGSLSVHQRAWGWGSFFSSLNSYVDQVVPLAPKLRITAMESMRCWLGTKGWFPHDFYTVLDALTGRTCIFVMWQQRFVSRRPLGT